MGRIVFRRGLLACLAASGVLSAVVRAGDECGLPCDFPNPPYAAELGVNLNMLPNEQAGVGFGDIVQVQLFAQPTQPVATLVAGIEAIITWDNDNLELCGLWNNGQYDWTPSKFPNDGQGVDLNAGLQMGDCGPQPQNEVPFNDGDAFYAALAELPPPFGAGEALLPNGTGLLVTTFLFRVITNEPVDANVCVVESLGLVCSTVAWGRGGQCSTVPFPCNALDTNSCPSGVCIPLDAQPGCNLINNVDCARILGPCSVPCGDVNGDGITDDSCRFFDCELAACQQIPRNYADMGSGNGFCGPDGACDGNDRFHALNCFANQDTGGPGTNYPCEELPPAALNVDFAGLGQPCSADGVCDGNDAFAALNCFSGTTTCTCNGPAPDIDPGPSGRLEASGLIAQAKRERIRPKEDVEVQIHLRDALDDIRGYQLHVEAAGGDAGRLELVDIFVEPRALFAGHAPWAAFNVGSHQMVAGLNGAGVPAAAGTYLATFVFRASPDASGAFTVDILADPQDSSQRSWLFPTAAHGWIEVEHTQPAVITVADGIRNKPRARLSHVGSRQKH